MQNHDHLKDLVEKFNIPFTCISADGLSREEHEDKMIEKISEYEPELIVLAKYMKFNSKICRGFPKKFKYSSLILPAFIGANPYKQAHEKRY